ncbi:hypothetical protein GCM10009555_068240 [Acrocarpospora macrocephala]|uniref:Pyridoxamine 5'-phosphate oxidase putative domain-containing protein n=1 Tax=Acrocarpospora macrocephala TaxID=150177 RepID=A0A5M3X373_9ACTN|nr:hypothetical protein [Acrocarpospora macrocephala]GES14549.1 hypothetical protein Amac_081460 [Acrocarpospora macrocephala]
MTLRLIEEGAKKSSVLWLALPAGTRLAWHVWHDGAIHVVTGGGEQELPGLAGSPEIEVILRSKDNGAQLVRFPATVTVLNQAEHPEVVAALAKERLNAIDSTALTARWATHSLVVRLTPLNAG